MTTHPSALDRDTRRNTLLDFADRQYPTDVERSLAATLLRIEFGEIDQAHAKAERAARDARDGRNRAKALEGRLDLSTERLRRARGQRDEARQQLAELNAAYGVDLRSVERERDDARDAYDRAERELAAAKAEAEGLAETMRNTDRLTTEDRERTRRSLAEARRLRDEACGTLDRQQLAVSDALGLGTSAPWDAITERARELHALTETAGTAVSASDVLEQHDVTRKAMCDALGAGYHLNWQQIIDTAQRSHNANAEWQREAMQHRRELAEALACFPTSSWADLASIAAERITQRQRAEDRAEAAGQKLADAEEWRATCERLRRDLADALGEPRGRNWVTLIGRAAAVRADWARCADEAERGAAADVAAARQAEELAGARLKERHEQIANVLGCDADLSWRDLLGEAGHLRHEVTDQRTAAQDARRAEAEAVRARQAAEAREQQTAATLRETETQLGDARRRARNSADEVKAVKEAFGAELDRAEAYRQHTEATLGRVRKATDALTPLAARHIEAAIAEPADDLTALTAPVSPRELGNCRGDHPLYPLADAMIGPGITRAEAMGLIKAYYDAITSGPPADPAELPQPIVINLDMTDRDMVKAIRKALHHGGTGRR